jgi:predicted negative regulator of RcsB-dependent stress response
MFTDAFINIGNAYLKEDNKQSALESYEKAKQSLISNTFYSNTERLELLKDIEESIKSIRQ